MSLDIEKTVEVTVKITVEDIVNSEIYQALWEDCMTAEARVSELEEEIDSIMAGQAVSSIVNLDDFKYRLREDGLLTKELEEFINYYMRYRNKDFVEGSYYLS